MMSAQSANIAMMALFLIGGVLIGLCVVMALALWWCTHHDLSQAHSAMIEKVCAQGNFKDVALALIGAVSALAGAIALKGKQT